jgi:glycine oxidase
MANPDVCIVGGGIIGQSVAWRLAQRGLSVTVVDPTPGRGASHTAAGLLAPVTELRYEGRELLALNVESARRYPAFVAELEAAGQPVGYRRSGTVQVAWDATDLADMRALQAFQHTLGVSSQLLTSRELRSHEPALAPGLAGGLLAADDHQIDNRALVEALSQVDKRLGVSFVPHKVATLDVDHGRVVGVSTVDGDRLWAGVTVLAAGAWSRGLFNEVPVRPVKGQTVRLRTGGDTLRQVVRGTVRGHPVYLAQRAGGELVVGASSEEAGFDLRARAGAVYELLRDAQALVPELSEAEFVEVSTSVRPGSPDDAPLLGLSGVDGLIVATGHYRNGILLTPVTADEIARLVVDGEASELIAPFDPRRMLTREVAR